jgi:hypothetical protein
MSQRKRILTAVIAVALAVGTPNLAAFAEDPYQYFKTPSDKDSYVIVVGEPSDIGNGSSLAVQPPKAALGERASWGWCRDAADKICDFTNPNLDMLAWQVMPNCAETEAELCVESLELAAPEKEYEAAEFLRTAKGGIRYPAVPKMNLHEASTPSLYNAPNAMNAGGTTTYAVAMKMSQHWNFKTKKFTNGSITATVIPYRDKLGPYGPVEYDATATDGETYRSTGAVSACAYAEAGVCGVTQDFTPGTRARVKFRIPSDIAGWFSGRLKDPEISITKHSATANLVTMGAESVVVPRLALVRKKDALTTVEKNFNVGTGGIESGTFMGLNASDEDVFKYIDFYRPFLKDTAAGTNSYWNMQTAAAGSGSNCLSDSSKVLGIVTTNAMGYASGSPSFNNGTLDYKVAGLHYLPGGKAEVEGTYNFVMRSETARCLYGFSKAPISARISVTSATGEKKVATTVVSEKNGWLKLAAYGFTFSSPTISVKLSQGKVVAKKSTITCVKGKLIKKVTAVGPKCPAGYKKK